MMNSNASAFPMHVPDTSREDGLTKYEYIATQVLGALVTGYFAHPTMEIPGYDDLAVRAKAITDEFIKRI
jgi:hypothetical protein